MDHLQSRLDALEQQMHTVNRRLRWWRGLACGLVGLAVLAWMLPAVTAQEEDAKEQGQKGLAQRVAALETLLKHFSREDNEVTIKGANLHLVNGLGSTTCRDEQFEPIPDCPNGLGNLIVGYNEPRDPDLFGGTIRTGSHNVVVGVGHNFSRFGGLVVGYTNTISGDFASVSGGEANMASGEFASVSGGFSNTASGGAAAVSGGGGHPELNGGNTASGVLAAVSGGQGNTASGERSVVSGGQQNTASGFSAVVSGGQENTASGGEPETETGAAVVSGGFQNTAIDFFTVVSGGQGNTASGMGSTVSGGVGITQENEGSWSAGSEGDEVVVGNFRSP
jgi:hypothetical protein